MNVDSFKNLLVSETTKLGFAWSEGEENNGTFFLGCKFQFPYYDDDCQINLLFDADSVRICFYLDAIIPSYDNLKLINDFNENVPFLKAHIARTKNGYFLFITHDIINPESEEVAVKNFVEICKYVNSQNVSIFLRPLTVITQ